MGGNIPEIVLSRHAVNQKLSLLRRWILAASIRVESTLAVVFVGFGLMLVSS